MHSNKPNQVYPWNETLFIWFYKIFFTFEMVAESGEKIARCERVPAACSFRMFAGFFFAFICCLTNVISNILAKKTLYFNGFEQATFRYTLQLFILMLIALYNRLDSLGAKEQRNFLITRGVVGAIGMIAWYISVKLANPSDTISIFSCHIVFTMILSRIYLKEKITIIHIIASVIIACGILFITQPSFVFPIISTQNENVTLNTIDQNSTQLSWSIGLMMAAVSGLSYTLTSILIKQLSNQKTHFSIVNLYASYAGLPLGLVLSIAVFSTGYDREDKRRTLASTTLLNEMGLTFVSALTGVLSQIFWIISLKYEEPSKISILKTADLLFTFLLQYYLLNIEANVYSICGACLIAAGTVMVMLFKIIEQKIAIVENKNLNNLQKIFKIKF